MEQTETYGLNKPGPDDALSPAPLNENADKLEAALAALTARVKTLERTHYSCGYYIGNGSSPRTISVGFTPSAVLLHRASIGTSASALAVYGSPAKSSGSIRLEIVSGGFKVNGTDFNSSSTGSYYHYIALR